MKNKHKRDSSYRIVLYDCQKILMNTRDSQIETGDLQTFLRRRVQRKSEFFYDSNTVYFSRYSRYSCRPKRNKSFPGPVDVGGVRPYLRNTRNPVLSQTNCPSLVFTFFFEEIHKFQHIHHFHLPYYFILRPFRLYIQCTRSYTTLSNSV